jgi:hypothetical protein
MLRKFALALAVAAAPFAVSGTASALTVQTIATNDTAWNLLDTSQSVALPTGASWTSAPLQMPHPWYPQVDPCVSFCSPFDPVIYGTGQTIGATPLPGWQQIPFWVTWQTADRSNVNVLDFGRAQSSFSLHWGSMDSSNLIEMLLNGAVVGTIYGNGLPGVLAGNPGRGSALIRVINAMFDELRFSSTSGGFEYSNVTAAPIPLPLPAAGLLSALGLLAFLRRRRA